MYKHTARTRHSRHPDYDLQADLERIKNAFTDAAQSAKDKATDVIQQSIENAKERSSDFHDTVGDYAKEKPFQTVGLAVLTGFVLGYLFHRK